MADNNDSQEVKIYGEIGKGPINKLRVKIDQYRGRKFLTVREYWMPEIGEEFIPTKKGITVPPEMLETFKGFIDQAVLDYENGEFDGN